MFIVRILYKLDLSKPVIFPWVITFFKICKQIFSNLSKYLTQFIFWVNLAIAAGTSPKQSKHLLPTLFLRIYVYVSLGDRRNKINNTREPLDQLKNPHPPEASFFAINESDRFFLQWFNVFWNRFTNHKAQKQVIWTMSWWQKQMVITFLRAGLWLGSSKTGKDQI